MGITGDYRNTLLDALFGSETPTILYLGLSTTEIDESGDNCTEPTAAEYARVAIPNTTASFPAAVDGVKTNGIEFVFPVSANVWGTVLDWALFISADCASTAANMIAFGQLKSAYEIAANCAPIFAVGYLEIKVDAERWEGYIADYARLEDDYMSYKFVEVVDDQTVLVLEDDVIHIILEGTGSNVTVQFDDARNFAQKRFFRITNLTPNDVTVQNFDASTTKVATTLSRVECALTDFATAAGTWWMLGIPTY